AEIAAGLDVSLVGLLAGLGPVHDGVDRLAVRAVAAGPAEREAMLAAWAPPPVEKIALIGLRGAGKSTIGALAAAELGCPFVEVDALVRERSGLSLADLFEIHGASGYRRVSRDVLREGLARPGRAVFEIGGSVVVDPEAWQLLVEQARVIWLHANAEEHLARVAEQGDMRPMEGHDDALRRLREILGERERLYRRAHEAIDTVAEGIEGSVAAVLRAASVG
ncbi:MAG: shikimate kinase, partial [Myxococcota bacterium]